MLIFIGITLILPLILVILMRHKSFIMVLIISIPTGALLVILTTYLLSLENGFFHDPSLYYLMMKLYVPVFVVVSLALKLFVQHYLKSQKRLK